MFPASPCASSALLEPTVALPGTVGPRPARKQALRPSGRGSKQRPCFSAASAAPCDTGEPDPAALADLLDRCLERDTTAWVWLCDRYQARLLRCFARHLADEHCPGVSAEEVVASLWSSLLEDDCQRLGDYDLQRGDLFEFLSWEARTQCRLLLRKWRPGSPGTADPADQGAVEDDQPPDPTLGLRLAEALATLTPRELRFYHTHLLCDEQPGPDDELSDANVRKLRQRCREKLRKAM